MTFYEKFSINSFKIDKITNLDHTLNTIQC